MRILFDKSVPAGVRRFLLKHEVKTFVEMLWPDQLENGELLKMAEQAAFEVLVTSDQNIRYQQNLAGSETRFGRPRLQYLAGSTAVQRGDNGQSRWSNTGRVLFHRNAAPAKTAKE